MILDLPVPDLDPSIITQNSIVADPGCLSRIQILHISDPEPRIPDPIFPGSRIRIKDFTYCNPKNSSRKYDPGCSSRIRIPDPNPDDLSISDPRYRGSKRHQI
jgi:hypothetical protein